MRLIKYLYSSTRHEECQYVVEINSNYYTIKARVCFNSGDVSVKREKILLKAMFPNLKYILHTNIISICKNITYNTSFQKLADNFKIRYDLS